MLKKFLLIFPLLILLTACVDVSTESKATSTPAAPLFVTSTLPPTKQALTIPTDIPPTFTATADPSITGTPNPGAPAACRDAAILVEDVTYPDNTNVKAGETFIKTWKLQNAGTCTWTGYVVAFVNGNRMSSPDSVPVSETERGQPVDVSVSLTAPSEGGTYRGNFELRNAAGEKVLIGTESIFWVQIAVGGGTNTSGTPVTSQTGNCVYTTNDSYVQQLVNLINTAREDVGRAPLTVNATLTKAAQAHTVDMACNDFLNHSGSDGTWIGDRLLSAGYPNSYYLEIIAIGLPQDAMNQWKNDKDHWDAVINSRITEMGVGYVYNKFSSYGGYWTVDMGGP